MMSLETESCVSRLLLNLADGERQIEISRQVLAQNMDFDPYQVFCLIDKEGKNSINSVDIVEFLRRNSICSNIQDVEFLILIYDINSDGVLSYSEFLNLVLSESNYSLRELVRNRFSSSLLKSTLRFNVEYSIAKLLDKELDLVRSTRGLIEVIRERYDFNLHDIYHLLKGYKAITQESLTTFLNRNNVNASFEDIKAMIKRLDFNKDGRIDFKEFHCLMTFPQCNHCSCSHHHCCFSKSSSPIRHNNRDESIITSQSRPLSSLNNNVIYQKSTFTPERNNRFISSPQKQEIHRQRVSSNLSLRTFPERIYSPKNRFNLKDDSTKYSDQHSYYSCPNHNNQNIYNSPQYSHHHHQSSPMRCNNIQCHTMCFICNCSPCSCCQISFEKGEKVFLNYFKEMMATEVEIEKAKIELALREDFNIEDAFKIFEKNGRGFITENDLKYGLCQLEIYASQGDLKLLMRRGDLFKTGRIDYGAFFDLVTPFDNDYRSMIGKRNQSSYSSPFNKADIFLLGTKITLQNLLKLIIISENKLEKMRSKLREAREQIKNVFAVISRGFCTFSDIDLASYLRNKDIFATDQESGLAFIRLDRNRNGKVELLNIAEELISTV